MKRRMFNVVLLLISFCLMLSVSFGWWIEGVVSDSFVIKSAKISSEITIYQGNDFNLDGNLDRNNPFQLLEKTEKGTKQVLVLKFNNLAPTEVYTWKIKVENNGDAAGFAYATLAESLLKDTGNLKDYIKFMSVTHVPQYAYYLTTDTDDNRVLNGEKVLMQYNIGSRVNQTFVYNGIAYDIYKDAEGNEYFVKLESELKTKVYLYNADATTALFGNGSNDIVGIGQAKEYVFQIQLEPLQNIIDAGKVNNQFVVSDEDIALYQTLQGTKVDTSFEFLDVSLSSTKLGDDDTTTANVNN